jgi:hypothetical protein
VDAVYQRFIALCRVVGQVFIGERKFNIAAYFGKSSLINKAAFAIFMATAFTVVFTKICMGLSYKVDAAVGVVPSSV